MLKALACIWLSVFLACSFDIVLRLFGTDFELSDELANKAIIYIVLNVILIPLIIALPRFSGKRKRKNLAQSGKGGYE